MTTKTRMTAVEIGLLREIVRWRRSHDGEYVYTWSRYRLIDGKSFAWLSVDSHATCMKIGVSPDFYREPFTWHRVRTIGEAVDLLVVLGYLPMRFSSAYRAGWDASKAWHSEVDDATFARMFHDPDNIAFPALEAS
jgi:hypothetical protein